MPTRLANYTANLLLWLCVSVLGCVLHISDCVCVCAIGCVSVCDYLYGWLATLTATKQRTEQ